MKRLRGTHGGPAPLPLISEEFIFQNFSASFGSSFWVHPLTWRCIMLIVSSRSHHDSLATASVVWLSTSICPSLKISLQVLQDTSAYFRRLQIIRSSGKRCYWGLKGSKLFNSSPYFFKSLAVNIFFCDPAAPRSNFLSNIQTLILHTLV